jgi:hypothetical protein
MFSSLSEWQIQAAKELVSELAQHLDIAASQRLWDGSLHPLGDVTNLAVQPKIRA